MILRPEPIFGAVEWLRERFPSSRERVVLLSPQGAPLGHESARRLAGFDRIILLCGRYEGIDERALEVLELEEISLGDYVLSGGEAAALAVLDATARLVPGVLGDERSAPEDSFSNPAGVLDHPHYTRPATWRGLEVPEILLSGNHAAIAEWRRAVAIERTRERRPDLLPPADPKET